MKNKLITKGFLVNNANGIDWLVHSNTKEVQVAGKGKIVNDAIKLLPKGTEYIVLKDYKSDKESEFVMIIKHEDEYLFATKSETFIDEVE